MYYLNVFVLCLVSLWYRNDVMYALKLISWLTYARTHTLREWASWEGEVKVSVLGDPSAFWPHYYSRQRWEDERCRVPSAAPVDDVDGWEGGVEVRHPLLLHIHFHPVTQTGDRGLLLSQDLLSHRPPRDALLTVCVWKVGWEGGSLCSQRTPPHPPSTPAPTWISTHEKE